MKRDIKRGHIGQKRAAEALQNSFVLYVLLVRMKLVHKRFNFINKIIANMIQRKFLNV